MPTEMQKDSLQYVINTGGNATIAMFDDDHEPIGSMLRRDLMPTYMVENSDGKLELTEAGRSSLKEPPTEQKD